MKRKTPTLRSFKKFLQDQGSSWKEYKLEVCCFLEDCKDYDEGKITWSHTRIVRGITKHYLKDCPRHIFLRSIDFQDTRRGFQFWNNLHNQWNQKLN